MNDIGKAFIMGAQVLMFTFALTIAVSLYSTLTYSVDEIMLASNYSNRGDAIVDIEKTDTKRKATKAEVIMAILDLKSKYEKTGDNSYKVKFDGWVYTYMPITGKLDVSGVNEQAIDDLINEVKSKPVDATYTVTYDESGKMLIYN